MQVNALDHVNIITDRLAETCAFHVALLGLEQRDAPPPLTPQNAQWLHDKAGRAVLHINSTDCPRTFDRPVNPGMATGAIHHVALNCSGYDSALARIAAMGLDVQTNLVPAIGLRQIFVTDPNNVLLELNFLAD